MSKPGGMMKLTIWRLCHQLAADGRNIPGIAMLLADPDLSERVAAAARWAAAAVLFVRLEHHADFRAWSNDQIGLWLSDAIDSGAINPVFSELPVS